MTLSTAKNKLIQFTIKIKEEKEKNKHENNNKKGF